MKHRKALKTTIAAALACYAVALVAPAASAKPHDSKPGGKKAIATVVSFAPGADENTAGTLTYTETGSTETMTVSVEPDAKIKVEHRGDHATGKGHGNPSRGDFEDLTEGTKILKMKGDETLDKIRIRSAPATTTACEDDSDEAEETEAEDADESDESDDTDDTEESDEDTEGSEDEDAPALMSKPDSSDDDCDDAAEAEDADEDGDEASDEDDTEESDEDEDEDEDEDDEDDDDDEDDIVTEIIEDVLP